MADCHMALSTGDDGEGGSGLTAWRNADAAFIEAELIPNDLMLGWLVHAPDFHTSRFGPMSTARTKDRWSEGRDEGLWKSRHAFQTCQFIWWLMQTTGLPTSEDDPSAGYNTHTLTIGATNVPDWHGIQFEREGITSNELRYALMGVLPSDLVINCGQSKENYKATQEITVPFAYLKNNAVI